MSVDLRARGVTCITLMTLAACGAPAERKNAVEPHAAVPLEFPRVALVGDDSKCANHDLKLTGVGDDLARIFAGRETPETGTRMPLDPSFPLTFNTPVNVTRLQGALRLYGSAPLGTLPCTGTAPGPMITFGLPMPALPVLPAGTAWSAQTLPSGQAAPREFSAVVFDDYSGTGSVLGPIAAGGNVTLQSFSANSSSGKPIAIVAGGKVTATNGSILGGIRAASTSIPQSVHVSGTISKTRPIDFAALRASMTALSAALAGQRPDGEARFEAGTLRLLGKDPSVNVFRIGADRSELANLSISVEIPKGALAIVNVLGATPSLHDDGITFTGADANHLLWNFPQAAKLRIASIALPGSVLAPSAAATVKSGSLEGTIVARSLQADSSLGWAPLATWPEIKDRPTILVDRLPRLLAGCGYTLAIDAHTPLDDKGSCLGGTSLVSFRAAEDGRSRFERETSGVFWTEDRSRTTRFTVRDGINLSMDELLSRYARELALGSGVSFVPEGPKMMLDRYGRTRKVNYAQHQLVSGTPVRVLGRGVTTEQRDGFVRALGAQVAPSVQPSGTASIGSARALELAIAAVAKAPYPWSSSAELQPPTAELVLWTSKGASPSPGDWELAWKTDFSKSGLDDVHAVIVDARSGAIRKTQSNRQGYCPGLEGPAVLDPGVHFTNVTDARCHVPFTDSGSPDWTVAAIFPCTTGTDASDGTTYYWLYQGFPNLTAETRYGEKVCSPDMIFDDPEDQEYPKGFFMLEAIAQFFDSKKFVYGGTAWTQTFPIKFTIYPRSTVHVGNMIARMRGPPDAPLHASIDVEPGSLFTSSQLVTLLPLAHEYAHLVHGSQQAATWSKWEDAGESNTIAEAFADCMAIAANHSISARLDGHFILTSGGRDAVSPGKLGLPSARGDAYWADQDLDTTGDSDYQNITIVSHWFVLLAIGEPGALNTVGQYHAFPALDPDRATALEMASRILFDAVMQRVYPSPTFMELRAATIYSAKTLYGDAAAGVVSAAWQAVNISQQEAPGSISPADQATDVNPWPTEFTLPPSAVPGSRLEISEKETFDKIQSLDVGTTAAPSVMLLPATRYFWRVVPPGETAAVQNINSFKTAEVKPRMTFPAAVPGEIAGTDTAGRIALSDSSFDHAVKAGAAGVSTLIASVHAELPTCGTPGWKGEILAPYQLEDVSKAPVTIGLAVDVERMLTELLGSAPVEGATYYVQALSIGGLPSGHSALVDPAALPAGALPGACQVFPIRLVHLRPPEVIAPDTTDPERGIYEHGVPIAATETVFLWDGDPTISTYRLVILEAAEDWATTGNMNWTTVFDEDVTPSDAPESYKTVGKKHPLQYVFSGASRPVTRAVPYRWYVQAVTADGLRTEAPPEAQQGQFHGALPPPTVMLRPTGDGCPVRYGEVKSIAVQPQPGAVAYKVFVSDAAGGGPAFNRGMPKFVPGTPEATLAPDGWIDLLFPRDENGEDYLEDLWRPYLWVVALAPGDLRGEPASIPTISYPVTRVSLDNVSGQWEAVAGDDHDTMMVTWRLRLDFPGYTGHVFAETPNLYARLVTQKFTEKDPYLPEFYTVPFAQSRMLSPADDRNHFFEWKVEAAPNSYMTAEFYLKECDPRCAKACEEGGTPPTTITISPEDGLRVGKHKPSKKPPSDPPSEPEPPSLPSLAAPELISEHICFDVPGLHMAEYLPVIIRNDSAASNYMIDVVPHLKSGDPIASGFSRVMDGFDLTGYRGSTTYDGYTLYMLDVSAALVSDSTFFQNPFIEYLVYAMDMSGGHAPSSPTTGYWDSTFFACTDPLDLPGWNGNPELP